MRVYHQCGSTLNSTDAKIALIKKIRIIYLNMPENEPQKQVIQNLLEEAEYKTCQCGLKTELSHIKNLSNYFRFKFSYD